jgi:hypothetical protein
MLMVGDRALAVAPDHRRVDSKLPCDVLDHDARHVKGIGEENSQESDRAELQGEAETVVVAATTGHRGMIRVIEVERARELGRGAKRP